MCRAVVDLLSADIREDHIAVSRVLLDQPSHLGKRRSDTFSVRVVEREAHPEDDAPLEALASIVGEVRRVFVASGVE